MSLKCDGQVSLPSSPTFVPWRSGAWVGCPLVKEQEPSHVGCADRRKGTWPSTTGQSGCVRETHMHDCFKPDPAFTCSERTSTCCHCPTRFSCRAVCCNVG